MYNARDTMRLGVGRARRARRRALCWLLVCAVTAGLFYRMTHSIWGPEDSDQFDPRIYMTEDFGPISTFEQRLVDYIGHHMKVRFEGHTGNGGRGMEVVISLKNDGTRPIHRSNWTINFYHLFKPLPIVTTHSALVTEDQFILSHVDGSFYQLTPTAKFKVINAGQSFKVTFPSECCVRLYSDVFPNWFISSPLARPHLIDSTRGNDSTFHGRLVHTKSAHFTPKERYDMNSVVAVRYNQSKVTVIPTPLTISTASNSFYFSQGSWTIYAPRQLQRKAQYLSDKLGLPYKIRSSPPKLFAILLTLGPVSLGGDATDHVVAESAYTITSDTTDFSVTIRGASEAAVFYGIQTLLSVYNGAKKTLHLLTVTDAPRYSYRGVMLDVARNFIPVSEILTVLDTMAMYKLNVFHFHLTDDQGWRLQIPGLEELTRIGSRRDQNYTKGLSLTPTIGSGPYSAGNPVDGYYTVRQYRQILERARDLHIQVIPEFDMPGHGGAAIVSMEARYRRFMHLNKSDEAWRYRLWDPRDTSEYYTVENHRLSTINPCMESTYTFVEKVIVEVKKMHQDILPLEVFHMGGDEIPKRSLVQSPICEKFRQLHSRKMNSVHDLVRHFIRRVATLLDKYSLKLQIWDDGPVNKEGMPLPRGDFNLSDVMVNLYQTNDGEAELKKARYINDDYKVIISNADALYFDHPQDSHPDEHGLYWAAPYINTQRVFSFEPDRVYAGWEAGDFNVAASRGLQDKIDSCRAKGNRKCIPVEKPQNVIGMQGHVWGEVRRTAEHLESMLYPRLLALAERAWHKAPWEGATEKGVREPMRLADWESFANALGHKELRRLEALGVNYYLPRPGAIYSVKDHKVDANTMFPGLTVQFSADNGQNWADLKTGSDTHGQYKFYSGEVLLATRSFDKTRRGSPVTLVTRSKSTEDKDTDGIDEDNDTDSIEKAPAKRARGSKAKS